MSNATGRVIHGKFVNQTITTPLEITWVDQNGNAVTLVEGDRINIVDVIISTAGTAKDVILFQDHNGDDAYDAAEELFLVEFNDQGTFPGFFGQDMSLRKINAAGTNGLHIVASTTGTVSCTVNANISRT